MISCGSPRRSSSVRKKSKGLKKIWGGWGFDSDCIRWDIESVDKTLKVNNITKVMVSVSDGTFHCEWEQSWKDRESFISSTELQELLNICGDMVAGTGKGKGKGKSNFE